MTMCLCGNIITNSYGAEISRTVTLSPTKKTSALSVYCSIFSCLLSKKMLFLHVWLHVYINYDAVSGNFDRPVGEHLLFLSIFLQTSCH